MKISNFLIFSALSVMLFACSTQERSDDISYSDWRHSLGMPQQSDMKPGGNTIITKETKVELVDPSTVQIAKTKGDFMTVMTRQFRKDLLSTGAKIKQKDSKIFIHLPTQAIFGTNQATIKPSFEPALKQVAENLKTHPETMVKIVGHTDNSDSVLNSKILSTRQANALSNYLRVQGVNADRLLAEGKGSLEPIASNTTAEGRAQNSYIEVIIYNIQ
jgi:outer membrane protein OmpA-like peptidoglycan-associated protein